MKSKRDLRKLIKNFEKVKIAVIGDVMLDRYWWGSVERISPEAPVPVVRIEKTGLVAGGAANVAANAAGLGAEVFLVGAVGNDAEGREIRQLLKRHGISDEYLLRTKNRTTTMKTRVVAHSQHVVRIDQENTEHLTGAEEKAAMSLITKAVLHSDIILISDYAKGFLSKNLLRLIISAAREKNLRVIIDPKGRDFTKYEGATLLTPNKREALEAAEISGNLPDAVVQAGKRLTNKLNLESLLITRGEEGMTIFEKNRKPAELSSLARHVYDVTGAGDTVIAALGAALAAGADLKTAAETANTAAGFVVEEVGTTVITQEKLLESLQ